MKKMGYDLFRNYLHSYHEFQLLVFEFEITCWSRELSSSHLISYYSLN